MTDPAGMFDVPKPVRSTVPTAFFPDTTAPFVGLLATPSMASTLASGVPIVAGLAPVAPLGAYVPPAPPLPLWLVLRPYTTICCEVVEYVGHSSRVPLPPTRIRLVRANMSCT